MNASDCSDLFRSRKRAGDTDYGYSSSKKISRIEDFEEGEGEEGERKDETVEVKTPNQTSFLKKNFGKNYLLKHGYKEGSGLGKYENGIVQPVEASKQRGTRGFGFEPVNLKNAVSKFDPSLEEVSVDEDINWLTNDYPDALNKKCLESWVKIGYSKKCVNTDSNFCDHDIINDILSSKNILNTITVKDIKNGRRRSNPFESIHKAIFLNRAAMKMANMDAILDWMFTEPKNIHGVGCISCFCDKNCDMQFQEANEYESHENFSLCICCIYVLGGPESNEKVVNSSELLYFADVCAGPGGFSEYVLFRKKWRAKGFGFTLRAENDFLLDQFWAGPSESFEPYYGAMEDGNVYTPENISSFKDHVLKHTENKGVHFMMADGGIHVGEKFNDQELLCKKLYLCQCLVALLIVRTEGHFVVKLFDIFTDFSVGLVYLMYRSFREIAIIKPNTSRPANSERYLVCKWKREDSKDIADHLFEVNKKIPEYDEKQNMSGQDVLELVPPDVLLNDTKFCDYIVNSNNSLGKRQFMSLLKLAAYSENTELQEERQQELRKVCLKKWKIPDEARAEPKKYDARTKWMELAGNSTFCSTEFDIKKSSVHSFEQFSQNICSIYSWYCLVLSGEESNNSCTFYLGLGRNHVHKYSSGKWTKLTDSRLCLPSNTLVYGEIVNEYLGSGRSQRKISAFHIIDGLFLGNEDIRHLPFLERQEMCSLFAKSLYKETCPVRVKKHYSLVQIDQLKECLVLKPTKSSSFKKLCIPLEEDSFFKAGGILFIRDTKGNWQRYLSKKRGLLYLHKVPIKEETFFENDVKSNQNLSKEVYGDFEDGFRTKLMWWWDEGSQTFPTDPCKLQWRNIMDFVGQRK